MRRTMAVAALVAGLVGVPAGAFEAAVAESLARLKAGNARFVADPAGALSLDPSRRSALARGQSPFATVLSCADSRVPPEFVFSAGLGDLFVVRAAGHVPDRSVLASLEYAAEHLRVPLIVVMGHEMCGAVQAAIDTAETTSLGPNLDYLVRAIRPATARASTRIADTRLQAAILENVDHTIRELLVQSDILRHLAEAGRITLVGAYYELASGRVHFSDVAPTRAATPTVHH